MNPLDAAASSNPFPGLRPFREDEEHLFFGRESQVDTMVDKLARTRFLAVVGPSGSGKSSLVNCGLRPALHRGMMASAGTSWKMAVFRPGSFPVRAMAGALAGKGVLFDYQPETMSLAHIVEATLRMSKLGLVDIYQQAQLAEGMNFLVVVDQFEELFRYRKVKTALAGESERSQEAIAFVNLLLEARAQVSAPIYVVLTMRSDFLGDCAQFPGLAEAINEGQYLVPRLTWEERKSAISGPAGVGGAEIDPALLTRLVNDVGDNPDQLSILQHALNRTWSSWQRDDDGTAPLALSHYEAIGSMAHALDRHAEEAYAELASERQKVICEKVFKTLTDRGSDARGIRRPTSLETLCALTGASPPELVEVIDVFREPSRSFLMPPLPEALKADTVIDISHESLMRTWERLKVWTDEEAQSAQRYRRLAETVAERRAGKAGLLRDPELQLSLDWRNSANPNAAWASLYGGDFEGAIGFLTESAEKREKDKAEQEADQKRELEQAQALAAEKSRSARLLRFGIAFAAVLAVAAIAAAVSARQQWAGAIAARERAEDARKQADAQRLIAQSRAVLAVADETLALDPELSALLALEVRERIGSSGDSYTQLANHWQAVLSRAVSAMHASSQVKGPAVKTAPAAISLDGRLTATFDENNTVRVGDATTGKAVAELKGHTGRIVGLAFSHDGKRLVSASWDKTARIWNLEAPDRPPIELQDQASLAAAAFSRDDNRVLTASYDGMVRVQSWDSATGKPAGQLLRFKSSPNYLVFGADGRWLAELTRDRKVGVWDVTAGRRVRELGPFESDPLTAAFDSAGNRVAAASGDGTLRVWDIKSGNRIQEIRSFTGPINFVSFSADGRMLVSLGVDNSISLFDVDSGRKIDTFLGHKSPVLSASFLRDDIALGTISEDGAMRTWSLRGMGRPMQKLRLPPAVVPLELARMSADGSLVATAGRESWRAQVWEVATGKPLWKPETTSNDHKNTLNNFGFTDDNQFLITAGEDKAAKVWNASSGELIVTLGSEKAMNSVAFSPDAGRAVSASADGTVGIWDGAGKAPTLYAKQVGPVNYAEFSPDGKTILTAGEDGTARIWSADNLKPGTIFRGHQSGVRFAGFSPPDGKRVMTVGADETIRIWDADSGNQLFAVRSYASKALNVSFSPDGKWFVLAYADGTVHVGTGKGDLVASLPGHTSWVFQGVFLRDKANPTIRTFSGDGTVRDIECEVCLSEEDLIALARRKLQRINRKLSEDERAIYLPYAGNSTLEIARK